MADGIEFKLEGLEELRGKLKEVSDQTGGKAGKSALLKSAQLIAISAADEWRKLDNSKTGQSIADNIVFRGVTPKGNSTTKYPGVKWNSRKAKQAGVLAFRVGVAGTAKTDKEADKDKSKGSPTPHWRLLEFGTSTIPARGIMRRAMTENIGNATTTFIEQYKKKLDAAIKRAKKVK